MSDIQLDAGAIRRLYHENATGQAVVVQLMDMRTITTASGGERYKVIVSDGEHFMAGMLASQLGGLVASNEVRKFSVVRLEEYVANTVQNRRVCILTKLTVLQHCDRVIGNPVSASTPPQATGPPQPAAPPQQYGQSRPQPPQQYQQQARPVNTGYDGGQGGPAGFGRSTNDENYQPVSSLNPYQSGWRIKVRVTAKDPIRYYKNARGEGKVCSLDLLDREGGEIRATMFNEAVDKFYTQLHRDKVYIISGGSIKMARKQYTHIKNDYAITLNQDSEVRLVDEDAEIERQRYNFVPINSLQQMEANTYVDVIGVVLSVSPISNIMSKKQQTTLQKRTVHLADQTARVEVTMWNQQAQEFDEQKLADNAILAIKAAKVSHFGGRSLSASSTVEVWPERPEANALRQWWQTTGQQQAGSIASMTSAGGGGGPAPRKTFQELSDTQLGADSEKGEYFSLVGTIATINRSTERLPWYKACPEADIQAKVEDDGKGQWWCAKTGKTYDSYEPRYILRFLMSDFSGQQWFSAFNDTAEAILGRSAKEAEQLVEAGRMDEFERMFNDATFKRFLFRCRARMDTYQDERRVRYDVVGVNPVDLQAEALEMMKRIQQLEQPGM